MANFDRCDRFDDAIRNVTQDRGDVYGHPLDDFCRVAGGKSIIAACQDQEVRHALEMIWVKVCRLIQTPGHLDSAIDIAGYARTICMIHDKRAEPKMTTGAFAAGMAATLERNEVAEVPPLHGPYGTDEPRNIPQPTFTKGAPYRYESAVAKATQAVDRARTSPSTYGFDVA